MAARQGNLVRYAVVGLGHIAQVAVLPAFVHARRNSRLVALVPLARLEAVRRRSRGARSCATMLVARWRAISSW
jgi:predicted dehydrogenase